MEMALSEINGDAAPISPTPHQQGNIDDGTLIMRKGPIFPGHDNSGLRRARFPKDFLFGVGTSTYQNEGAAAEGGKSISIWDDFALSNPGNIIDGTNGNAACDMYHRYKEDIRLMKQMGLDSYRFSISWPRILPGGRCSAGVNREGIDYYNDLINTVIANGMKPYVTLFHWDLPKCLEKEYGGFLSRKIKDDFREFAEVCFWEFGDRVKLWNTINEPWTYAVVGYVLGLFPPGRKVPGAPTSALQTKIPAYRSVPPQLLNLMDTSVDEKSAPKQQFASPADAYFVGRNMLLAHAEAVKLYKTKFQEFQQGKIGITLNSHWFVPYHPSSREDAAAALRGVDFMLGWFLNPILFGSYPKTMIECVPPDHLASFTIAESMDFTKYPVDFIGLNYYTTQYAQYDSASYDEDGGYYVDQRAIYGAKGPDDNDIGEKSASFYMYVVPWGLYYLLLHINEKYPSLKEIFIAENGVATENNCKLTAKQVCRDDDLRTRCLQDHLANIIKVMEDYDSLMKKVKGYFVWTWCDNFEWASGYTERLGLIYIDYMNNMTRYPKDSAEWYAKFLTKPPLTLNPSSADETTLNDQENDDEIQLPKKRLKAN